MHTDIHTIIQNQTTYIHTCMHTYMAVQRKSESCSMLSLFQKSFQLTPTQWCEGKCWVDCTPNRCLTLTQWCEGKSFDWLEPKHIFQWYNLMENEPFVLYSTFQIGNHVTGMERPKLDWFEKISVQRLGRTLVVSTILNYVGEEIMYHASLLTPKPTDVLLILILSTLIFIFHNDCLFFSKKRKYMVIQNAV